MNAKQFEKLLSAYLDHELTESERLDVEKQLEDAAPASLFEELRRVSQELRQLPSASLPPNFLREVLARLQGHELAAGSSEGAVSELMGHPQLALMAYFDGELTQRQRRSVEELLLTVSKHRKTLLQIAEVSSELAELPRLEAPSNFREQLQARLRAEIVPVGAMEAPEPAIPAAPSWRRESSPSKRLSMHISMANFATSTVGRSSESSLVHPS